MGQVLHGSATMTKAVRPAIQNSQGRLKVLERASTPCQIREIEEAWSPCRRSPPSIGGAYPVNRFWPQESGCLR